MPLRKALVGVVLASLAGCTRAADLQDQLRKSDYHLPFDKRLRFETNAPIIVLGHVVEVNDVGQPRRSPGDARIKTQLTRIKIDVEEVIKGDVRANLIEFSYFVFSPQASEVDLGVPRYLPNVGQRRIYFLKASSGIYRSVGDVTDYTLRVSSGNHPKDFCQGKSPGCCIAEMLLVPQQDVDTKSFVADLIQAEYAAEVLCSRRTAQDLMQKLTQSPDQRIADRAREIIAGTQSR
jgi:hypothetical protein